MPVVELKQVTQQYQKVTALENLSLSIHAGEVMGLFGHNGAGKTTTMKLILGLISPTLGEVKVMGRSPSTEAFHPMRYQLGFLPENVSFYPQLTGREVLYYFAKLKRVGKPYCEQLLEKVGLIHAAHRKVKTYSKGMKQRLGLAQAILTTPKLLLLDEPTVGLDPIATRDFYTTIDELKNEGCAVVLCSHVLPGLEKHIDRAAVLSQGKLRALGTLTDLRKEAQLPIRVHIQGTMDRNILSKQTQHLLHGLQSNNGTSIEGFTSEINKMPLLKQLMSIPGVEDVDVNLPTLEQLYTHLMVDGLTDDLINKKQAVQS